MGVLRSCLVLLELWRVGSGWRHGAGRVLPPVVLILLLPGV